MSGFYKREGNASDQLMHAPNWVIAPGYELLASAKDSYVYPIEGWAWFDSIEEAAAYFGVPVPTEFNGGTVFTPTGEAMPNWNKFWFSFLTPEIMNFYNRVVALSFAYNNVDASFSLVKETINTTRLVSSLFAAKTAFRQQLQIVGADFTPEEITAWNNVCDACNMPDEIKY